MTLNIVSEPLAVDFPLPPSDFAKWYFFPGVSPQEPIPFPLQIKSSGLWDAPAPNSYGAIPIRVMGSNLKLWKFYGMSKNLFGSAGRPEGPWSSCAPYQDCTNGWCHFDQVPVWQQVDHNVIEANWAFGDRVTTIPEEPSGGSLSRRTPKFRFTLCFGLRRSSS